MKNIATATLWSQQRHQSEVSLLSFTINSMWENNTRITCRQSQRQQQSCDLWAPTCLIKQEYSVPSCNTKSMAFTIRGHLNAVWGSDLCFHLLQSSHPRLFHFSLTQRQPADSSNLLELSNISQLSSRLLLLSSKLHYRWINAQLLVKFESNAVHTLMHKQ